MIRINVDELRPGMWLARPIYGEDGRVLLAGGVELRESFIARLKEKGYSAVYIGDERTEDVEPTLVIPDELRFRVTSRVRDLFTDVFRGGRLKVEEVLLSVDELVDEILKNRNVVHSLTEMRSIDNYTFGHSVNVCILSVLVGLTLGMSPSELRELGVGAILHDIGKVRIASDILVKEGRLDLAEMEEVKRHTRYGFDMLREYPEISLRAAHVAYQHHERINGRGYPRGLRGDEIHPLARIVMVVDTFDAMTSDRVYRRAVPQHAALALIGRMAGRQFAGDAVRALLQNVARYPVGARVFLNTGEMGVVIDVSRRRPDRPIVRVLSDAAGEPVYEFKEVDLAKHDEYHIVEVK